jgi:hypothetical protein
MDAAENFFEKCSYQCLKEHYESTLNEFTIYEEMENRLEETGGDFLTKNQIRKYIFKQLKPRLWFIKRHIKHIAKSEEAFPAEVLESQDMQKIIEEYDELERNG